jgi:hypothetical protein
VHIQGNLFQNIKNEGIVVTGAVFGTVTALYDSITILGNTFDNTGIASPGGNAHVISLSWASKISIDQNTVKKGFRGIYLTYVDGVTIGDQNFISDQSAEGILITETDVSFNFPAAGEPGYDPSITSGTVKTWYKNKGYTSDVRIGGSRIERTGRTAIYLNFVKGFRISGVQVRSACLATDADRDAIRIENYASGGEVLHPAVFKNPVYTSGRGGANRYAVNVLGTCSNIRVLPGFLEGKAQKQMLLAGTDVWCGIYLYSPDGTRYKAAVSDGGQPVLLAE